MRRGLRRVGGGSILVSRTVVNHPEKRKRFDILKLLQKKIQEFIFFVKKDVGQMCQHETPLR